MVTVIHGNFRPKGDPPKRPYRPPKHSIPLWKRIRTWFRERSVPLWVPIVAGLGILSRRFYAYAYDHDLGSTTVFFSAAVTFSLFGIALVGFILYLTLRDVSEDDD